MTIHFPCVSNRVKPDDIPPPGFAEDFRDKTKIPPGPGAVDLFVLLVGQPGAAHPANDRDGAAGEGPGQRSGRAAPPDRCRSERDPPVKVATFMRST